MKSMWSVVTVYEGAQAREAVVSFCQTIVQRFWLKLDFDVRSWSFKELEHPDCSQEAAEKAAAAEMIVIATELGQGLPWHVQGWVELWLGRRHEREGTLAALQPIAAPPDTLAQRLLRQVAHRAGMNFLTEVPQHIPDPLSDSPEVYTARAQQVTSVLNGIMRQPPPPAYL